MTRIGAEIWAADGFAALRGKRVGLVMNQASMLSDFTSTLDAMLAAKVDLRTVFGPQHGLWGHTQDNMIEWEGEGETGSGFRILSLYGEHREPTDAMLAGLDVLVVDLPDVGARYYTFIWTLALCMRACSRVGLPVVVLDRPNPIGGEVVEGPRMRPEMESFVGLFPIVARHGMTIGEIARWLQATQFPKCELSVVEMEGWTRNMHWPQTGRPWAMPSPNMPTYETALVYSGMCLFEGTKMSEGRGTTRPFEILGAPGVDGARLAALLNAEQFPGVVFRPYSFEPTFQKHARQICGGVHWHVTDPFALESVEVTFVMLQLLWRHWPDVAIHQDPPYEYVWDRRPLDLLTGDPALTAWIEEGGPREELEDRLDADASAWRAERQPHLLYG
ncbi:MAG: DUF1343 domain-containing protein [Chthonomonas sp.]|nr:DUF1343 domain-containing protein [Chthonomonas sp.]